VAADIVATPNPVYVSTWSVSQQGPTTIAWDTGDPAVEGTVWITDDGGTRKFVDHTGKAAVGAKGSAPARIGLGKQVLFALKRTDTPALNLDTVLVAGREQLGLPIGIVDDIRHRMPLVQGITNVRVFPGIESVRIMFRTRQPTTPVIDVKDSVTHALAGAAFPFLQGAKTTHDYAFPLPQNTDFTFHILAAPGAGALSTAKSAEATGQFRTGFRDARVFFDRVFVHTDGDPGSLGDGDFTFDMGVGDTEGGGMIGARQLVAEISGGENRAIDESVAVPGSPVGLWVQVRAVEDDSFDSTPYGAAPSVSFAPEGATWEHWDSRYGEAEVATVTKWFDLSSAGPVAQEIPFTLETGPRHIDFSLHCRIRFEARQGVVVQPMFTKSTRPGARAKSVATMRVGDRVTVAGRTTHAVQLAPDGVLYHAGADDRPPAAARSGNVRWMPIAGDVHPPLTAAATADVLHLLMVGKDGDVMHRSVGSNAAEHKPGKVHWTSLGGGMVAPVVAAVDGDRVELFASNAEGAVFHRTLEAHAQGDWQRIGEGMAGSLNAFKSAGGGIGLVARARNGDVMHLPWTHQSTRAGSFAWHSLGKAPPGSLSVEGIDDAIVLAVLADDETVHAAAWRDDPGTKAALDWKALGTMNALISARYSLLAAVAVPPGAKRS
jgi:hypothetical protein